MIQTNEGNQKDKEDDIFHVFSEIKKKTEELKLNTYTEFWKHSSNSKSRLILVFDSKNGKMQMAFLQAQNHFEHYIVTAQVGKSFLIGKGHQDQIFGRYGAKDGI